MSKESLSSKPRDGDQVGRWHLEVVTTGWDSTRRLMDPLFKFSMGDQDTDHPGEYQGEVNAPNPGYLTKIEFDPSGVFLCDPGDDPPQHNPCSFVDYVNLYQISDQQIHYHARNHGGRCEISLLIYWRGQVKVTTATPEQAWKKDVSFLVFVPTNAVDATVIGKMGDNDILFTPSVPLEGDDAKRFKLIQTKLIDGVGAYYTFIVVDPFPTSVTRVR